MKRFKNTTMLFFVILLFLISPAALANSSIQAFLFPATFSFNGEERQLESSYEIINYNDYTYVPIRFVAEALQAGVDYDESTRNIEIQHPEVRTVKSEVAASYEENDFLLAIYSEKESYRSTEFPAVWATLTYIGDKEIELEHDISMIQFGIIDEHGNEILPVFRINETTPFQKYEQFYSQFLPQHIKAYNANTSDVGYVQASSKFPEGQYTIYASTLTLSDRQETWEMTAEIDIRILP